MDAIGPTTLANGAESAPPAGLTAVEHAYLRPIIELHHTYPPSFEHCSFLLSQRTSDPTRVVWSIVCRFDRPDRRWALREGELGVRWRAGRWLGVEFAAGGFASDTGFPGRGGEGRAGMQARRAGVWRVSSTFIRNCSLKDPSGRPSDLLQVGCLRELSVISGLPASTSTKRLDILDKDRLIFGFTIIGGEHRLCSYRSVTTVNEVRLDGEIRTIILESYVVDVPDDNTVDDTKLLDILLACPSRAPPRRPPPMTTPQPKPPCSKPAPPPQAAPTAEAPSYPCRRSP